MATKNFKGFQLVALATFNGDGFTKDKDTLYFVRTNEAKSDGFLYFNGKKYGTAEDAKKALTDKYGELNGKTISAYVADEIKKVTDAATALEGRVTANTQAIERINGTGDGSISKAVSDAKKDLLGDAADGYNTLGKLEDKIQAEATTARAEEKKNADAIAAETTRATAAEKANADTAAAAKDAADKAQQTADEKVKSVEGTDTVVATTNEHAVSVSLKTSDKGNVKFTQDVDGLSANVTIPEATVTGVKADDKFLSLADKLVSADVSIAYDAADKKIYLLGKDKNKANAVSSIDCTDFIKDGMLDSADLVTNPTGQTEGTYIKLTWNTDGGKAPMYINVTSLIDTYTAKANGGLVLEDHAFSVDTTKIATTASVEKLNATHAKVGEDFKTVATEVSEGIAGIAETSKASAEGEADVKVTVTTKSGSVSAVAVDSSRLAQKVTDNTAAIAKLNGNSGVTGSVDQKIKAALEAGAVTLEVKDNDAYLGVSATTGANGTVYTLASKEAAINKAIKDAADAVKVSVTNGTYVKGSVDEAGRAITLSETVQEVATSSGTAKGLAEASDVKNYVDQKVSDKNVAAEGESGDTALVSATASGNKVTVAATPKLKAAVAKAESSVQSVNSKTGSTITLTGADIATNQNVSGSANATVNAVLADIYSKIGAVKVSSQLKTITVDTTGRIIDVNRQAIEAAQQAGHVALECGDDGALYGVMYYSGDDIDETIA